MFLIVNIAVLTDRYQYHCNRPILRALLSVKSVHLMTCTLCPDLITRRRNIFDCSEFFLRHICNLSLKNKFSGRNNECIKLTYLTSVHRHPCPFYTTYYTAWNTARSSHSSSGSGCPVRYVFLLLKLFFNSPFKRTIKNHLRIGR